MGKVEEYRKELRALDSWDTFLLDESHLPGPRANLELAFAVASEGSADLLLRYAALDRSLAPSNTPQEFLAFCGVLGLGYLAAKGEPAHLPKLQDCASDSRWRIREAVALGLQRYGQTSMDCLLEMMAGWSKGNLLERRAVVASLCEPSLLSDPDHVRSILGILCDITASVFDEGDRRSEAFKVLRKGLAYGWSVVVAAQPSLGKPFMERWIRSQDPDIRWIMRQSLKKKRLLRMDEAWVSAQLVALES